MAMHRANDPLAVVRMAGCLHPAPTLSASASAASLPTEAPGGPLRPRQSRQRALSAERGAQQPPHSSSAAATTLNCSRAASLPSAPLWRPGIRGGAAAVAQQQRPVVQTDFQLGTFDTVPGSWGAAAALVAAASAGSEPVASAAMENRLQQMQKVEGRSTLGDRLRRQPPFFDAGGSVSFPLERSASSSSVAPPVAPTFGALSASVPCARGPYTAQPQLRVRDDAARHAGLFRSEGNRCNDWQRGRCGAWQYAVPEEPENCSGAARHAAASSLDETAVAASERQLPETAKMMEVEKSTGTTTTASASLVAALRGQLREEAAVASFQDVGGHRDERLEKTARCLRKDFEAESGGGGGAGAAARETAWRAELLEQLRGEVHRDCEAALADQTKAVRSDVQAMQSRMEDLERGLCEAQPREASLLCKRLDSIADLVARLDHRLAGLERDLESRLCAQGGTLMASIRETLTAELESRISRRVDNVSQLAAQEAAGARHMAEQAKASAAEAAAASAAAVAQGVSAAASGAAERAVAGLQQEMDNRLAAVRNSTVQDFEAVGHRLDERLRLVLRDELSRETEEREAAICGLRHDQRESLTEAVLVLKGQFEEWMGLVGETRAEVSHLSSIVASRLDESGCGAVLQAPDKGVWMAEASAEARRCMQEDLHAICDEAVMQRLQLHMGELEVELRAAAADAAQHAMAEGLTKSSSHHGHGGACDDDAAIVARAVSESRMEWTRDVSALRTRLEEVLAASRVPLLVATGNVPTAAAQAAKGAEDERLEARLAALRALDSMEAAARNIAAASFSENSPPSPTAAATKGNSGIHYR
eukprot:TRINITY_DN80890_c0_g1_i1.p1 TRINITY_DN80890_c0_g1~~TRINITY_DN80890_c0_g1_i1.p1  ORF type:complete len:824 (+),score=226.11 TRINITY_DN80890_c0_g1_i1:65-2536(+)